MKKLTLTLFIVVSFTLVNAQKNIQVGIFNVPIVGDLIGTREYTSASEEYYLGYRNDSLFYTEVWIHKGSDLNTSSYSSVDVYSCAMAKIERDDLAIEQVIGEGYQYFRISLWTNYKNKKEQFIFTEYKDDAKKVKKANDSFKTV